MSRVLVLSPHPDDESIGCGGTLRRHVLKGDVVRVIFLTSGEKGGHGLPPEKTGPVREKEAEKAARILGLQKTEFWRQADGMLRISNKLVARLRRILEKWLPDVLYVTHAKEMLPDHRAAARLVRRALRKMIRGFKIPDVLMFEVWTPIQKTDVIVDISAHVRAKTAAIRSYQSQCKFVGFDEAALGLSRYRGELYSWPGGDYAEVFERMPI